MLDDTGHEEEELEGRNSENEGLSSKNSKENLVSVINLLCLINKTRRKRKHMTREFR